MFVHSWLYLFVASISQSLSHIQPWEGEVEMRESMKACFQVNFELCVILVFMERRWIISVHSCSVVQKKKKDTHVCVSVNCPRAFKHFILIPPKRVRVCASARGLYISIAGFDVTNVLSHPHPYIYTWNRPLPPRQHPSVISPCPPLSSASGTEFAFQDRRASFHSPICLALLHANLAFFHPRAKRGKCWVSTGRKIELT